MLTKEEIALNLTLAILQKANFQIESEESFKNVCSVFADQLTDVYKSILEKL